MFNPVSTIQLARLSLLALAALAVLTVAAMRLSTPVQLSPGASPSMANSIAVSTPVSVSQLSNIGACGGGAYVTGDMAGDASPSTVFATLCGMR